MVITIITGMVCLIVGAGVMALVGMNEKSHLKTKNAKLDAYLHNAQQQLKEQEKRHQREMQNLKEQQHEQMEQQMKYIKEHMNTASEQILRNRQEQLAQTNAEQMSNIVNPLKDEIKRMHTAVHNAEVELKASIKSNLEMAEAVGKTADKLAQALIGENKKQGNFGELRLKQLLDDMGFEEGMQYEQQVTMRDSEDRVIKDGERQRLIPDVILHFPENRDIIIDSKVSLTAFEEYYNTDDEQAKKIALGKHVNSVKAHVNELAKKDYSKYLNGNKLDVVIMYIFSESALQLALSADPALYKDAYDKRVIICGSNNLYALLRVLESSWKQMKQVENQQEIVKAANNIVERVQMFAERFREVENQLKKTQNVFDDVKKITSEQGKSIIVAANKLKKYGASESARHKPLPKPAAEIEDEGKEF